MREEHICPVEMAGVLDNWFRRLVQKPKKILKPYIKKGMTVVDYGCGPGFFSIPIAEMIGETGRLISVDIQKGMLEKVKNKIAGKEIEKRIKLHLCNEDRFEKDLNADFLQAFYVVHEMPDQERFFMEVLSLLKPRGLFYFVEPHFHVSKKEFDLSIEIAKSVGFKVVTYPKLFLSRAVVMEKETA